MVQHSRAATWVGWQGRMVKQFEDAAFKLIVEKLRISGSFEFILSN